MMNEWVKRALAHSGLSQSELTRRLASDFGWSSDRSIINKIIVGRREVSAKELLDISAATGYQPPVDQQSAAIKRPEIVDLPNANLIGRVKGPPVKVPVYGQAVGGEDGEFELNGNVLYEVLAPPVISEIKNAYAVLVSGSSMSPRYEDGEICFVDPERRVKPGDYVIVQIQTEEHGPKLAFVKKLVRWTTKELVLQQFNPPKELVFDGATVVSVHYIALSGNA